MIPLTEVDLGTPRTCTQAYQEDALADSIKNRVSDGITFYSILTALLLYTDRKPLAILIPVTPCLESLLKLPLDQPHGLLFNTLKLQL